MEDSSSSRRRVRTGRKLSDGAWVAVVFEATRDGYVCAFQFGASESVEFDLREVSKLVQDLRDLQAIALQGVRWHGID